VTIQEEWTVVLDVPTPYLNTLTIKGTLLVQHDAAINLAIHANLIDIRGGRLIVGNATHPFEGPLMQVVLHGDMYFHGKECTAPLDPFVSPIGCWKQILVNGELSVQGKTVVGVTRTLAADALAGATSLTLDAPVDSEEWFVGADVIVSSTDAGGTPEYHTVASVSGDGTVVALSAPLAAARIGTTARAVVKERQQGFGAGFTGAARAVVSRGTAIAGVAEDARVEDVDLGGTLGAGGARRVERIDGTTKPEQGAEIDSAAEGPVAVANGEAPDLRVARVLPAGEPEVERDPEAVDVGRTGAGVSDLDAVANAIAGLALGAWARSTRAVEADVVAGAIGRCEAVHADSALAVPARAVGGRAARGAIAHALVGAVAHVAVWAIGGASALIAGAVVRVLERRRLRTLVRTAGAAIAGASGWDAREDVRPAGVAALVSRVARRSVATKRDADTGACDIGANGVPGAGDIHIAGLAGGSVRRACKLIRVAELAVRAAGGHAAAALATEG
jgi:hypothetical protein